MDKVLVTLSMDIPLRDAIDKYAWERQLSRSEVIRTAIINELNGNGLYIKDE